MKEDLCEASGEEAREGGNILLNEEKEELLRRISVNPRTRSVFANTSNVKRFSTSAVTKGDMEGPHEPLDQSTSLGVKFRVSSSTKFFMKKFLFLHQFLDQN